MIKILEKFKIQTYNIGIINYRVENILKTGLKDTDIVWLKGKKKDRFYADPFLWKEDKESYYFFVELYLFWEEKGKIAMLKVKKQDFSLIEEKIIIEEDYHLSFPYCDYYGNYIMPESSKGNGTYKYLLNEEGNVIGKEKISDDGIIDGIILDREQSMILGTTKCEPLKIQHYWKFEGGKFVERGIVKEDIGSARNAGKIFNIGNKQYRPAQNCKKRYGEAIKIMHLDPKSIFREEELVELKNPSTKFNETMHTFNVYNDCIVIDGSKDFIRFPMKAIYKIIKFIRQRKG